MTQAAQLPLPDAAATRRLFNLTGQTALVTGGGSGLGRAMAWGFACYGANVVILDRDAGAASACVDEIARGTGCKGWAFRCDVSDEAAVAEAVAAALGASARIDILVNNAGHNIRRPLLDYTLAEFDSLHEVHVRGTFLMTRAVGKHMLARGSGAIINIASMLGHVAAPRVAPYAAAKAAIIQLTKVLSLELAPHVRVNAIAPGYIDTPLTRQHAPEIRQRIMDTAPLGRFGEASELIGPALFLASSASSFVTGTSLLVDGGWTAK
ncbi:MAG: glucose 1-dehydrogenase [Hyphomicrobiales bacterium]|nr:MAG: glucose 1-dehydrogenase [Hyphomicrobiales bacterium]